MNAAKWLSFRKTEIPAPASPEPSKPEAAGTTPVSASIETPDAPAPSPVLANAEPAPSAPKPEATLGSVDTASAARRASRLVEAGRTRSTRLGQDLKSVLGKPQAWHKPAAAAALALAVGGVGYGVGRASGPQGGATAHRLETATAEIRESRAETVRLGAEMKSVRAALDSIRSERDRSLNRQSQLSDRLDKSAGETAGKIGKLAEQLERIERTQRDPARLTPLTERLDRLERGMQVASAPAAPAHPVPSPTATPSGPPVSAPTPPPKPTAGLDVNQTGSLAEGKPDARRTPVEGYVLRDIDDGLALIESRNGRYFEVSPGMTVPGLGRVEAIERRGRQWVVVTSKGFIGER